ncbi:MAG: sulfotransferase domain-containing protein [Bauldia sp.]
MIRSEPNNPKGIVWLASYPKSGNTWLRVFLYQLMRLQGGHPREENELDKLDRASGYEAKLFGLFEQFLGKPLAQATPLEVMSVRALVQSTIAERMPAVALVKTHNLFGDLRGMPTINTAVTAGGIYIVRDPRDVAPSLAKHIGSSIDQAIAVMNTPAFATSNEAETAFEMWGSWSQHVESWAGAPDPALLVVRYEDLMGKPTETFTAIVRHLGQDASPARILEAIELSSFDKLKRQEEETGFRERSPRTDRFFVSGKAGAWREKLTPAQADAIAAPNRAMMAKFGYA